MILSLWRSLLLAGGSWLLIANQSYAADVAFTTYAFPATGTPTSRTLPDRLAQIKNVRDFGAVGDGVTDDLAAIMAAFNWTSGNNRGTLYFPPGTYYVSGPIDVSNQAGGTIQTFVYLVGHMGVSTIVGNFADYVIKRAQATTGAQGGGHIVEKLTIINQHASGGGIQLGVCVGAAIRDCDITANFAISTDNQNIPFGGGSTFFYSLEFCIDNCNLRAYNALASGSFGIARGSNGPTTNCTFKNFDTGVRTYGGQGGLSFQGCYFETNNYGIANDTGPGQTPGTGSFAGALTVSGCYFKNNGTAIRFGATVSSYRGILIEAAEGTITGNPQYGIRLGANEGGDSVFAGISVKGQYQVAGISIAGGDASKSVASFVGVSSANTSTLGGVNWVLPSTAFSADFVGCNVAPVFTMAQLPAGTFNITSATWSAGTATIVAPSGNFFAVSSPGANIFVSGVTPSGYNGTFPNATVVDFQTLSYSVADPGGPGTVFGTVFGTGEKSSLIAKVYEGGCFNVSNANTATWGAAALSGGSNHVKLRYTPQAWTVVGK